MQFDNFEQALKICLTAQDGSAQQEAAMVYCLAHAPADLKELLRRRQHAIHSAQHDDGCHCGCNESRPSSTSL